MSEQPNLFDPGPSQELIKPSAQYPGVRKDPTFNNREGINPCLALYGPGPAVTKCKTCTHLFSYEQSKRWYKCDLRKMSHSVATDHRVNWPSCGKYEEAIE